MTNVSFNGNTNSMPTLDKMWKKVSKRKEDIAMEDVEEKEPSKTSESSPRMMETNATANTDDDKSKDVSYVRFKFKASSVQEAIDQHKMILSTIQSELETFHIVHDNGESDAILAPDKLTYHELGNHSKYFVVIHGIASNQAYFDIKRNHRIFATLKKINCYMQLHLWEREEWDIVNIGFISGVSPKHQAKAVIQQQLTDGTSVDPTYELVANAIKLHNNNVISNTYAYEVKCKRTDIDEVCNHIAKHTNQLDLAFIKHQWKFTNPETYLNGIKKQNEFIHNVRTIPIYGITTEAMNRIYKTLTTNTDILDISSTAKTNSHGRWNAYTQTTNFESTTKWLQKNLPQIYNEHCDNSTLSTPKPNNFNVEVKFNTEISFTPKKPDPLFKTAQQSVSKYSSSNAYTQSWASVVRTPSYSNYSNQTSNGTSSLTAATQLSQTLESINKSIAGILQRLSNIETTLDEHTKNIKHLQEFEQDTATHMARISNILEKLEERTNYIHPRKLDQSFEQTDSNKRRDVRNSPGKGRRE